MKETTSSGSVLLLGGDLNAAARVEAAARSAGLDFRRTSPMSLERDRAAGPVAWVVADLDAGRDVLDALERSLRSGLPTERVLAFFSHVDEAAGAAATALGVRTLPRGRFWRELPDLVRPRT